MLTGESNPRLHQTKSCFQRNWTPSRTMPKGGIEPQAAPCLRGIEPACQQTPWRRSAGKPWSRHHCLDPLNFAPTHRQVRGNHVEVADCFPPIQGLPCQWFKLRRFWQEFSSQPFKALKDHWSHVSRDFQVPSTEQALEKHRWEYVYLKNLFWTREGQNYKPSRYLAFQILLHLHERTWEHFWQAKGQGRNEPVILSFLDPLPKGFHL